jgi:hypothetical protein
MVQFRNYAIPVLDKSYCRCHLLKLRVERMNFPHQIAKLPRHFDTAEAAANHHNV